MIVMVKRTDPDTKDESQKMYIDGKLVIDFIPTEIVKFIRAAYQAGANDKNLTIHIDSTGY